MRLRRKRPAAVEFTPSPDAHSTSAFFDPTQLWITPGPRKANVEVEWLKASDDLKVARVVEDALDALMERLLSEGVADAGFGLSFGQPLAHG